MAGLLAISLPIAAAVILPVVMVCASAGVSMQRASLATFATGVLLIVLALGFRRAQRGGYNNA